MTSAIDWYDAHAADLIRQYAGVDANRLHAWFLDLIPGPPSLIMDIGAGNGRDASWFASKGHTVLAVAPSTLMLKEGEKATDGKDVRWIRDSLPGLLQVTRSGLSADLVLVNAVWQHIPPEDRPRAFRKLVGLLRSGGVLALTLRNGPAEQERQLHPVSTEEVERLARAHGMSVVLVHPEVDFGDRKEISWTNIALRLPDDGTGSLPLLRHIILDQSKSSTYKLCLLRALCRAADGSAGLARQEDDCVIVPLGLIALNWIRLYLPLLLADLPQTPSNVGAGGLSFAGEGFRALLSGATSPLDLRVGRPFGPETGKIVFSALQNAANTIATMPARYLTYPNGGPILEVRRNRVRPPKGALLLDAECLWSFGELRVPRELWQTMSRFAAWIEPSLVSEWDRMMNAYAERQGRRLDQSRVSAALTWSDPDRDVTLPRQIATAMIDRGSPLYCVWSGRRLEAHVLDIDHCLPWTAWPCGDLWNLMPADRRVNQHQKRGKLPSHSKLLAAQDAIADWWRRAYLCDERKALASRFAAEAKSSLAATTSDEEPSTVEEVFAGVELQRLRLWQDQKVPEWHG